jgi:hypothetical protein
MDTVEAEAEAATEGEAELLEAIPLSRERLVPFVLAILHRRVFKSTPSLLSFPSFP